jgi:hypothetical protein
MMMGWSATVRTWYGAPYTNRTFSVVQQYPCLVAPRQSQIPFPDEQAKSKPQPLYLQSVLNKGRLRITKKKIMVISFLINIMTTLYNKGMNNVYGILRLGLAFAGIFVLPIVKYRDSDTMTATKLYYRLFRLLLFQNTRYLGFVESALFQD